MKKMYLIFLSFAILSVLASGLYYVISMASIRNDWEEGRSEVPYREEKQNQPETDEMQSVEVSRSRAEKVQKKTRYQLVTYNAATNTTKVEELKLPAEWLGLTREELIVKTGDYMDNLSLDEAKEGLISFELTGFSENEVKLKKTYDIRTVAYEYYAGIWDGMVVIYHSDKKTVYEYTGIQSASLPEEEQGRLAAGIGLRDEEELYGLLEAYSS